MEIISHPVVALIVLLGILVFGHELGHYLVGRWCGIAVEMFSIGFGPPIVRWRRGETEYRISWIPLGGFVKFYGAIKSEPVPDHARGREFFRASTRSRALTVAAGPVANLLIAALAYAVLGYSGIPHPAAVVGDVRSGTPADQAGLRYNDTFREINGQEIKTWQDMERIVSSSPNVELKVKVERDGKLVDLKLTPAEVVSRNIAGREVRIGQLGISRGFWSSIVTIFEETGPAYLAGLRTGDRVTEVFGQTYSGDVKHWRHLLSWLRDEVQAGSGEVTLTVESQLASDGSSDPRSVTLSLAGVEAGQVETDEALMATFGIRDSTLTIGEVKEQAAGILQPGDRIIKFGSREVNDFIDLSEAVLANEMPVLEVSVQRNGEQITSEVELQKVETQTAAGKRNIYTVPAVILNEIHTPEPYMERFDNPLAALQFGAAETMRQSGAMVTAIYQLFTGDLPLQALGGPILIAKVAGDSAKQGWQAFVMTLALISVNLAIINLFPIPVLDGGQLVLIGAEVARRRPLSEMAIENFQKIGFVMVLGLIILATYNDFSRYWTSILRSLSGGNAP